MASFTMKQLLELHGLGDRLHDKRLTGLIAHKLRLQGWRLRVLKFNRKEWRIWSDVVKDSEKEVRVNAHELEEMATKVMSRLPIGNVELNNARWFE